MSNTVFFFIHQRHVHLPKIHAQTSLLCDNVSYLLPPPSPLKSHPKHLNNIWVHPEINLKVSCLTNWLSAASYLSLVLCQCFSSWGRNFKEFYNCTNWNKMSYFYHNSPNNKALWDDPLLLRTASKIIHDPCMTQNNNFYKFTHKQKKIFLWLLLTEQIQQPWTHQRQYNGKTIEMRQ